MTNLAERVIDEIVIKNYRTMNYGEFESAEGEGVYRTFEIISVVRITTASVDGVCACNMCTKNSHLLLAGRYGFQAPVKERFSVPMQRDPNPHSAARAMGAGCLSRRKIGRHVALTTNPLLAPGSSMGRAKLLLSLWLFGI
jgi:hypothetical protein